MKISFWLKIVFFVVVFCSTFAFYSRAVFGASIALDVGSTTNILNGVNSFSSGSFNFSSMNPALLPSTYDSINQYLYNSFGYDVSDAIDYGANNLTGWATGQISNPLNGADSLASASANFVADVLGAGMTAQMVIENGFQYFAQRVPQWGENAKQFFLGKIDDVTGKVTDVGSTVVTKVTADGLQAYNSIYDSLVNSGDIVVRSDNSAYIGNTIYYTNDRNNRSFSYTFSSPVFFCCYDDGSLACYVPLSECTIDDVYNKIYPNNFISGYVVDTTVHAFDGLRQLDYNSANIHNINGVDWYYFATLYNNLGISTVCRPRLGMGGFSNYLELLEHLVTNNSVLDNSSISYEYVSDSFGLALKNQLDRLLDNYVDSLTLQRINDIISTIPIDIVDNNTAVSVPTQDIIDELTAIIDDAIEDSLIYDTVFDAYYEDAVDTPSTPDPPSDDIDIYVPIDVPTTPINAIGSALTVPYMFSSIFEPIFIAFGGGLFSLWLFVPTLIIFVAILWAIK